MKQFVFYYVLLIFIVNMVNNTLQKFLDQSDRKQNKILLDKVSEFDNRSMKPWLQENDTEMNSTNKEEKSVVVQRFIGTLKIKVTNM